MLHLSRAVVPTLLLLLAGQAGATLFPYTLVDPSGVPRDRCATGDFASGKVWPTGAGHCHDAVQVPCVADPPNHLATAGLHESGMCSHVPDSTPDRFPLGLCDMSTNDPAAGCTPATSASVCGNGGACSPGGCAPIGGIARCSMPCFPFVGSDVDCDGTPNATDACPWYPSTLPEATAFPASVSPDRRAPACLCGDQTADGTVNVSDIVGVNLAIFSPLTAHPLCDANGDRQCNVGDIVAVNTGIFNPGTTVCNRHPLPAP